MARTRWMVACGVLGAGVLAALASVDQPGRLDDAGRDVDSLAHEFGGESTFTRPAQDAEISFRVSTQVLEVAVSIGDQVAKDGLLIQGDLGENEAMLKRQKERAESDIALRRAIEQHELAKVELERVRTAEARGGANEQELNRARVSAAIAAIDVEQARWNAEQEKIALEQAQQRVELFSLRAPFDCRVVSVDVDVGDTLREGEAVINVVSIDPLHIDVDAPLAQAMRLTVGDPAWVLIGVPGDPLVERATVIGISPYASFAARSRRVRVEIDNARGLPAGLPAWVRFSEPAPQFEELMANRAQSIGG